MTYFYVILVTISAIVLVLGLVAGWLRRSTWFSQPLLALAFGVGLGPVGFHIYNSIGLTSNLNLVEQVTRITLAIALMASALQLPYDFFRRHLKVILVLLGGGMVLMWMMSSLIIGTLTGLGLWTALLIGAAITPTDPVLAASLLEGPIAERNLPTRVREILVFESGANDGVAYTFILLPLLVLTNPSTGVWGQWLWEAVVLHVVGAVVIGVLLGYGTGWLARRAIDANLMVRASFLGITLALSLLTVGVVRLVHGDGLIGVFVAGLVFNGQTHGQNIERQQHLQETIERFFDLPVFVLLGVALPWQMWLQLGWTALWLPIAVLLLRRIPVLLALKPFLRPSVKRWHEALFMGWFGPIGISALFYAAFVSARLSDWHPWAIVTLIVTSSVVAHGVSATPVTRAYGRYRRRIAPSPPGQQTSSGAETRGAGEGTTSSGAESGAPRQRGEPAGTRG